MLACSHCNAPASGDGDAFCEACGSPLPAHPVATPAADPSRRVTEGTRRLRRGNEPQPTSPGGRKRDPHGAVARGQCAGCGAVDADAGDGYCNACGAKLLLAPPPKPKAPVAPPGAILAGFRVLHAREDDDVIATDPAGGHAIVAFGEQAALEREALAVERFADAGRLPSVLGRGRHETYGAWNRLSPPPEGAEPLDQVATVMDVAQSIALVDALLDFGVAFERAGFGWAPRLTDMVLHDGVARLLRVRVESLAPGARANLAPLVRALGACLVPWPATLGPTRFVRLLVAPPSLLDADRIRAELEAARSECAMARREREASVAAASDVGLHHAKNEDAFATESGEREGHPWVVLVVCDGVSTSGRAEQAAGIAARTACDVLAHFMRSGDVPYETTTAAVGEAIRAAHVAVCATPIPHGNDPPPGTTIVAALLHRQRLSVGWVGDSRAYWIGPSGGELLTRDHSWINDVVSRGEMTEGEAAKAPLAHAITRCLGPLEVGARSLRMVEPELRASDLAGPGMLLLCTDGLWNYFPGASELAAAAAGLGPQAATGLVARHLVNRAVALGGADNVTVALARVGALRRGLT